MTAKQFFKSTAFKCVVTLLCVLLVCGVFLTVMNGLLEVTADERFNRAINKIYGKSVNTEKVAVADYNDNATIDEAYKIKDDGNYLIKATGKGGFDNGTVTCWIVIVVKNGKVNGVGKVVIDSNKSQSYIANINDKFLSAFSQNYTGEYFTPYDDGFIRTGATRSATAICNAVNGALDFVNAQLGNTTTKGERLISELKKLYGDKEFRVFGNIDGDKFREKDEITVESEEFNNYVESPVQVLKGKATVDSLYFVVFSDKETGDITMDDISEIDYVITSTGTGGYQDGTVTCRTVIALSFTDYSSKIYDVTITGDVSQSQIGDINYLDKFKGVEITEGVEFNRGGGFITTGSTMSSNAINNAVNGAVAYILAGGEV